MMLFDGMIIIWNHHTRFREWLGNAWERQIAWDGHTDPGSHQLNILASPAQQRSMANIARPSYSSH